MNNRPLRVFLCHSSNDKPAVRELYQKLRAEPWIEPWLDEEELYPGQDWETEIEKAVESSDVVLVCLSNGSINKRGFVQKELRFALDIALEMPEETIFIVPLRLEECTPPRSLRDWQYADYFEDQREHAFKRLLVSFKKRANSLGLVFAYKETILDIDGNPVDDLVGRAILLIRDNQRASVSLLQDHLRISYLNAINLLDKLEAMGVVGPSKERDVFVGDGDLEQEDIDEEDIAADLRVESLETKLESVEKKPSIETPEPEFLPHPTPEWIKENKITLSNGMEFMRVPAGKFLMGDEYSFKPQHTVEIPHDYWMARYPITNALYNAFVIAKGVKHPVDGWEKRRDHPVHSVYWDYAMEYSQRLNNILKGEMPLGLLLRLPTEAEWEKAARGIDGREYPWGNEFDKDKCNTRENNKGKGTTPIGSYSPQGDSPYGCTDMLGNVLEWTHSKKKEYPYVFNDGREDENVYAERVLRGWSYLHAGIPRCYFRHWGEEYRLPWETGFRVCIAPPLPK